MAISFMVTKGVQTWNNLSFRSVFGGLYLRAALAQNSITHTPRDPALVTCPATKRFVAQCGRSTRLQCTPFRIHIHIHIHWAPLLHSILFHPGLCFAASVANNCQTKWMSTSRQGRSGPKGARRGAERGSRSGVKWPGIKLHKSRVTLVENNVYNNG